MPIGDDRSGLLSLDFCHVNTNVRCGSPGFQKKDIYIYFPSTEVYHKNYTENSSH